MSIFDDDILYQDQHIRSIGALIDFKDTLREYLERFRKWEAKSFPIKPYQKPSSICPQSCQGSCAWKALGVYVPREDSPYISNIPCEIIDKEKYRKELCEGISSELSKTIEEACKEYSIGMYELDAQTFNSQKIRGYLVTVTSSLPGVILIRNIEQISEEEQSTLKNILIHFWENDSYIWRCPYVPIFTTSKGNPNEKPVILTSIKELEWYGNILKH